MKSNFRIAMPLAAAALLAVSLSACVVVPARPAYYGVGPVVEVAPPVPQVEVVGVPPISGQIWIGGFWGWEGGRHVWHAGHWDNPRPGYHWVPHTWVREGNGWRMHEGHWDHH